MKLILVLLIIIASSEAAHITDFSVHVKGKFLCRDEPYSKWPLDIFADNERLRYEDYASHFTLTDGTFDVKASITTDAYMITPYVLIQHYCWESEQVPHRCNRKIIQSLPPANVTVNSKTPDEKRTYDFGIVDLRFKHPAEVKVTCGK